MPSTDVGGSGRGRSDLIAAATLVVLGVVVELLSPGVRLDVTYALRATILAPVLTAQTEVARRSHLSSRLAALEAERDSLARGLVRAGMVEQENGRLRDFLELGARPADSLLVVQIEPGRVPGGEGQTFMVRAGNTEGVDVPAGVFGVHGVIGILRSVTGDAARGQFWTHPDFRVSVRTASGEASGIVRPGDDPDQPTMILDGAPYQTNIPAGTVLYTSGLGGVFPPGIPVGTVRSVSAVESGWEKSYRVEPAVRPEQVDVAFVWRKSTAP